MEGGISELKTIFLEVSGAGPRKVRLRMHPTPRSWIERAWDCGKKDERGLERATKQGQENPVRMKPQRQPLSRDGVRSTA